MKKIAIILVLIIALTGCGSHNNGVTKPNTEPKEDLPPIEPSEPIMEQIDSMALEEKVGQIVMVGLDGFVINDNAKTMIEQHHVGGFVILGRNIKSSDQVLSLINSLKSTNSKNKVPLFISVDEEGGRVSRMPSEFKKLPTNRYIGELNNADLSFRIGSLLAVEVKAFGYNMNFAPVLDINSNLQNSVIGDRSFSSDAKIVANLGISTMKGIKSGGVIPVVKHFPGHGDTYVDSHVGLPSINYDMDRLNSFELIPFNEAIKNGADAVMIAHILMNKIDSNNPASISKAVITGLLRNQLAFDGLVITDDMTMGAIIKNYDIGDAAIRSFNAGSDIILICHGNDNETKVINALKEAVTNGSIPEERVNESLIRILKLKQKYNLKDETIDKVDIPKINQKINELSLN